MGIIVNNESEIINRVLIFIPFLSDLQFTARIASDACHIKGFSYKISF